VSKWKLEAAKTMSAFIAVWRSARKINCRRAPWIFGLPTAPRTEHRAKQRQCRPMTLLTNLK